MEELSNAQSPRQMSRQTDDNEVTPITTLVSSQLLVIVIGSKIADINGTLFLTYDVRSQP